MSRVISQYVLWRSKKKTSWSLAICKLQSTVNRINQSIEDLFPENLSNNKAKDEIYKIKRIEQEIIRDNLIFKISNKKEIKHMIFKSLKPYNLLQEKVIIILLY